MPPVPGSSPRAGSRLQPANTIVQSTRGLPRAVNARNVLPDEYFAETLHEQLFCARSRRGRGPCRRLASHAVDWRMRGGALPPALLLVALGLALGFVPNRAKVLGLTLMGAGVLICMIAPVRHAWLDLAFLACWISIVATAAAVYLPQGLRLAGTLILSLNAGIWATAVVTVSGSPADLLVASLCVLVFIPASWLVNRGGAIAVKVASSWLVAVAAIAATLHFLPATLSYLPGHLE
jgi:hypothetical protein